jgi:hypothetical protein
MGPSATLGTWFAIWTVTAGLILLSRAVGGVVSAGLVTAFVVSLATNYWIAAAIYLLPSYSNFNPDVVTTGFRVSAFAVIAFGLGSLLLAPALRRLFEAGRARGVQRLPDLRLAHAYMAIGLTCVLVLFPIVGRIPTINAIVIQGLGLVIVGLALGCWYTWHRRSPAFVLWLLATISLPFLTVVLQGFLGYGTAAATAVLALIAAFYRPRWATFLVGLILAYVGLSVYVTYMRDRVAIRDAEGLGARSQRVNLTLANFEFFDPSNQQHLERIDVRLNQNYLVGAAAANLDAGLTQYSYGQTLSDGLLSLVPRAIWPSKPLVAGSGDLVSRYTGLVFAQGTAIGIGSIMEAYISFGTVGVVVGFLLFGAALATVDRVAGQRLQRGDWLGFVGWFLPGLSLLLVGSLSSVVEITSSVGAAMVMALAANRFIDRLVRRSGARIAARKVA